MTPAKYLFKLIRIPSLARNGGLLYAALFLFFTNQLSAQMKPIHGEVASQVSGEKIAFASISWKKAGTGSISDSTGAFTIYPRYGLDTLIISHVGYESLSLVFNATQNHSLIRFELVEKKANEVLVNKKYNRGLLWWKKVIQRKAENDPRRINAYSCDLYKKMEMDLTNITPEGFKKARLLKSFQFLLAYMDSVSENKSFLPVYIKETMSSYWYRSNPAEKLEYIQASRSSGLKNEVILHFLDGLKSEIDVYDNSLILFGKEFISPLSDDASDYYNFKAADTMYVNGQPFLHLFFSPKRPGENDFSGDCWIHRDSWGVSSISLKLSSTADINYVNSLSIRQEFVRNSDNVWIFYKNQFVSEVAPLTKNKMAFIVKQTSITSHLNTRPGDITTKFLNSNKGEEVTVDDSAGDRSAAYWENHRPETLSLSEQRVYQMMDTLNRMPLFDKYRNTIDFIVSGRKKMGDVEIGPWYKWISTNSMEKLRLRFDLATSEKFSEALYIHSYLAYGVADNQFNGGIDFRYKLPGKGGYSANGHYVHDLDNGGTDKGGVGLTRDNMFSQLFRKPGVPQKYYHVDEYYLGLGKEWTNMFSVNIFMSRASYQTYAPLPPQKFLSSNQQDIINTSAGIVLRYAPGEKKISTYRKDYRYRGNEPVFEMGWAHGFPGIFGSMYTYDRVTAQVSQTFRLSRWGSVSYRIYGGKIGGESLPFMLLEVHPGNDIYYYSKQSFNLMNRFEYLSDRYAGFTMEHDFEKKLINLIPFLRKINVRQFWNIKAVWGDLSPDNKALNCMEYGGYAMQSLNGHPYIELGTGLDNIFRFFRLDFIWRLTPSTAMPVVVPRDNYQKPAAPFGVFVSFQVQF